MPVVKYCITTPEYKLHKYSITPAEFIEYVQLYEIEQVEPLLVFFFFFSLFKHDLHHYNILVYIFKVIFQYLLV